jgi:predicted aminopeptidase
MAGDNTPGIVWYHVDFQNNTQIGKMFNVLYIRAVPNDPWGGGRDFGGASGIRARHCGVCGCRTILRIFFYIIMLTSIYGCSTASFLSQAVTGHCRVMGSRVSIEKIIRENRLDSLSRDKLRMILELREFASEELGLPRNRSYTRFSEIKEEYLGWNVYAAPKFSVEPITWSFPIAGRVVYRGYFSKEGALKFAKKIEKKGNDVYVSPISAYSTLGWYDDPVLSSHLRLDEIRLAGLFIHELAHQQLYIKGDSRFNESFAVTVERAGVLRWIKSTGRENSIAEAVKMWEQQDATNSKMLDGRSRLSDLYHSGISPASMEQKKDSMLKAFIGEIGRPRFGEMNNAFFVPVNTYYSMVPKFQSMLDSLGGDFKKFYREAEIMSKR